MFPYTILALVSYMHSKIQSNPGIGVCVAILAIVAVAAIACIIARLARRTSHKAPYQSGSQREGAYHMQQMETLCATISGFLQAHGVKESWSFHDYYVWDTMQKSNGNPYIVTIVPDSAMKLATLSV